jgi:hypothetical protein
LEGDWIVILQNYFHTTVIGVTAAALGAAASGSHRLNIPNA